MAMQTAANVINKLVHSDIVYWHMMNTIRTGDSAKITRGIDREAEVAGLLPSYPMLNGYWQKSNILF